LLKFLFWCCILYIHLNLKLKNISLLKIFLLAFKYWIIYNNNSIKSLPLIWWDIFNLSNINFEVWISPLIFLLFTTSHFYFISFSPIFTYIPQLCILHTFLNLIYYYHSFPLTYYKHLLYSHTRSQEEKI